MARKLIVVVVDALRGEMLERAVLSGAAPTFAKLIDRGALVRECVSSFPSVTPVASSEITTGTGPQEHWISGMNWYHRVERRYVEYGTSWEATRRFGMFRTLYDTVYNMNMAHLSHEVETVFERLGAAGVRTACTPYLIYRGPRRHELGLEGLMRRAAVAAKFHHAVWGPDELFYGELYASRRVPCRPTLARPGTRDEYSACVGTELVEQDLYDFMLFSLPDNDFHSHRFGPDAQEHSIAHADRSFERVVQAAGGMDGFLEDHALIMLADHAQTGVSDAVPVADALATEWRVLQPNADRPEYAELAVSPSARAASVYVLLGGRRHARAHEAARRALRALEGIDLICWLCGDDGKAPERFGTGSPGAGGLEAVVERADATAGDGARAGRQLRFRPGSAIEDLRENRWDVEGELGVLQAEIRDGRLVSDMYPNPLERIWSALRAPHSGDILASLAVGYECVDWGGASHLAGGSHGSLHRGDSLAPLLMVGFEAGIERRREQWSVRDIAGLVASHYGSAAETGTAVAGR